MNDSDSNIMRALRHEPCEGHCNECGACVTDLDDLDSEGYCADCDHDWTRCPCGDCDDERQLARARQDDRDPRNASL